MSPYIDLHERQVTQEVSMYILMFWQDKHIHEMKAHDHSINLKWEYMFKNCNDHQNLGYTSTLNGHK